MATFNIPVWISVIWLSFTVLVAVLLDATSVRGWLLTTVVGVIPVGVLLRIWNDGPPPTIAEVLHSTEGGR
jgi:hypothetical protein